MPDPHKIFVAICKWTEKDSVSEWTPLYGQLIYEGNEIKYDAFGRVLGQANFQVPREFYQQEIDLTNHVRYYCFVNVDEKTLVYKEVGYNQQSSGGGGGGGEGGGGTQTRFITAENGVLTIPAENDWLNIWRVENGVEVALETPSEAGDFLVSADFMMGSTAHIFTFDNNITWKNGVSDFPANETKHLKFEYVDGGWVGYEDPAMSQYVRKVNSNNGPLDVKYDGYKPIIFVDYRNNYDVLYIGCDNDLGGAITNHKWKTISIGNIEWVRICPSNTLDIRCTADDIRYNTYRKNQKGGFCISDATTGNLTIPGAPIYKGEYYQSLTAVSDGEGHNVITVPALTGEYYVCTVAQGDIITFSATTTAYVTKFSFDITVPETSEGSATPVTFSFSDTTIITWEGGSQPTFGVGTHKLKFECVNGVWYGSFRNEKLNWDLDYLNSPLFKDYDGMEVFGEAGSLSTNSVLTKFGLAAKWTDNTVISSAIQYGNGINNENMHLVIDRSIPCNFSLQYSNTESTTGSINIFVKNLNLSNKTICIGPSTASQSVVDINFISGDSDSEGLVTTGNIIGTMGNANNVNIIINSGSFNSLNIVSRNNVAEVVKVNSISLEINGGELGHIFGIRAVPSTLEGSLIKIESINIVINGGEVKDKKNFELFPVGYNCVSTEVGDVTVTLNDGYLGDGSGQYYGSISGGAHIPYTGNFLSEGDVVIKSITINMNGGEVGCVLGTGINYSPNSTQTVLEDVVINVSGGIIHNFICPMASSATDAGLSLIKGNIYTNISGGTFGKSSIIFTGNQHRNEKFLGEAYTIISGGDFSNGIRIDGSDNDENGDIPGPHTHLEFKNFNGTIPSVGLYSDVENSYRYRSVISFYHNPIKISENTVMDFQNDFLICSDVLEMDFTKRDYSTKNLPAINFNRSSIKRTTLPKLLALNDNNELQEYDYQTWDNSSAYKRFQNVIYNGEVYNCIGNNTNKIPSDNEHYWTKATSGFNKIKLILNSKTTCDCYNLYKLTSYTDPLPTNGVDLYVNDALVATITQLDTAISGTETFYDGWRLSASTSLNGVVFCNSSFN